MTVSSVAGFEEGVMLRWEVEMTAVITEVRDGGREIVVLFADGHQQSLILGSASKVAAVGGKIKHSATFEGRVVRVDAAASQLHVGEVCKVRD